MIRDPIPIGQFNLRALLKDNDISAQTQQHLGKVFGSLVLCTVFAAGGTLFQMQTQFINVTFAGLVSLGLIVFISLKREANPDNKLPYLAAFGFMQGVGVTALIELSNMIDPTIVPIACVATFVTFASFALCAMLSKRRSYLYMGATLSSMLSFLFWSLILNRYFFQSAMFFEVQIYLGLAMFVGYVVFDTQMIIEKASNGDNDHVNHAMELFIDLIGLFVRILVILLKNADKKKASSSSTKKNRR